MYLAFYQNWYYKIQVILVKSKKIDKSKCKIDERVDLKLIEIHDKIELRATVICRGLMMLGEALGQLSVCMPQRIK